MDDGAFILGPSDLGEVEAQQLHRHQLGREGLGGRNPDLGAGPCVENGIGLAGQSAESTTFVTPINSRALRPGVPNRRQSVEGFPGLGDPDDERAAIEDRIPISELGGDIDLNGQAWSTARWRTWPSLLRGTTSHRR